MKTPTLEEVKEYFKNAKEVRCLANTKVYTLKKGNYQHNHGSDGGFYSYEFDDDYVVIYTAEKGYAKIVNKTKNKDTYTVSKDFILEAHKDACSTWKTKIENQFPELFHKVELEVGKWYKVKEEDDSFWFVEKIKEDGDGVGYGFCIGEYKHCDTIRIKKFTFIPATKEEVETALIAEAKKRGFKDGVSINNSNLGFGDFTQKTNGNRLWWDGTYLNFGDKSWAVFKEGKWAEIISEPIEISLDEIAQWKGVDVSLIKIKK